MEILSQAWTAGVPKTATGTKAAKPVLKNLETVKAQAILETTQCGNRVPPACLRHSFDVARMMNSLMRKGGLNA